MNTISNIKSSRRKNVKQLILSLEITDEIISKRAEDISWQTKCDDSFKNWIEAENELYAERKFLLELLN